MGLEEKRAIAAFEKEALPKGTAEIKKIVGKDIKFDFDWTTFDHASQISTLERNLFECLGDALKEICVDELGKKAVKEALSKVAVKHAKSDSIKFNKGTLDVVWQWTGGYPTKNDFTRCLEAAL